MTRLSRWNSPITSGSKAWNRLSGSAPCCMDWTETEPDVWTGSDVPHSPQNFEPESFGNPHRPQQPTTTNGVPHWLQNFRLARFSCWHWKHCIPLSHTDGVAIDSYHCTHIVGSRHPTLKRLKSTAWPESALMWIHCPQRRFTALFFWWEYATTACPIKPRRNSPGRPGRVRCSLWLSMQQ